MIVWLLAVLLYAAFLAWYQNWRPPLSRAEVDGALRRMEELGVGTPEERAEIRGFLEADDGREFLMLNLVKLHPEPARDPKTGQLVPARELIERYTSRFVRSLLRKGGHPAFLGFPVGPYVDSWGVEPDPGWTLVGMMRYRSRRDMIELVTDPAFADAHLYKHAAIPTTFSFPMGRLRFFVSPRLWVGLCIALGAALLRLAAS